MLCRSLHLDESTVLESHEIEVGVRPGVLGVVEVQAGDSAHDSDAYCRDEAVDGRALDPIFADQPAAGLVQGDAGTRDRSGASSAICAEHIAVDQHRMLAESLEIRGRPK